MCTFNIESGRNIFIKKIFILSLKKNQCTKSTTKGLILLCLFLLNTIFIQTALAQRVSPMVFELEPFGSKSSTSMRIENTKQSPLTIEITADKLNTNELGKEQLTEAEDDFLIFPPQMIIQPGKTQIVRVKYIGKATLTQSQAYRIAVKQLPINIKQEGVTNIGVAFNFYTLLNITPKKSKPNIKIEKIEKIDDEKWQLTINNTGDRFIRLSTTQWEVSDIQTKSKKRILKSSEVSQFSEINFLAPKQKLILKIPRIDDFEAQRTNIAVILK